MSRRHRSPVEVLSFEVERLESRRLLDGNVSVLHVNGDLHVTGDSFDNHVAIDQVGLAVGQFRVSGEHGTRINGQIGSEIVFDESVNLRIDGGDGYDVVDISNSNIAGRINVINADGGNQVSISDSQVGKDVRIVSGEGFDATEISNSTIAGRLIVNNASGGSHVGIAASQVAKDVRIVNGEGFDEVRVGADSSLSGRLIVRNGNGGSRTEVSDSEVERDTRVTNKDGFDQFSLVRSTLGRKLTVRHGDNGSFTEVIASEIRRNYDLTTSDGEDLARLDQSALHGRTTLRLGGDDDVATAKHSTFDSRVSANGAAGSDTFEELDNTYNAAPPKSTSIESAIETLPDDLCEVSREVSLRGMRFLREMVNRENGLLFNEGKRSELDGDPPGYSSAVVNPAQIGNWLTTAVLSNRLWQESAGEYYAGYSDYELIAQLDVTLATVETILENEAFLALNGGKAFYQSYDTVKATWVDSFVPVLDNSQLITGLQVSGSYLNLMAEELPSPLASRAIYLASVIQDVILPQFDMSIWVDDQGRMHQGPVGATPNPNDLLDRITSENRLAPVAAFGSGDITSEQFASVLAFLLGESRTNGSIGFLPFQGSALESWAVTPYLSNELNTVYGEGTVIPLASAVIDTSSSLGLPAAGATGVANGFAGTLLREAESAAVGDGFPIPRSAASNSLVWHLSEPGDVASYQVDFENAGEYAFRLHYSNNDAGSGDALSILVNNVPVGTIETENTGDWNVFTVAESIPLGVLPSGSVEIAIRLDSTDAPNGIDLDFFELTISPFTVFGLEPIDPNSSGALINQNLVIPPAAGMMAGAVGNDIAYVNLANSVIALGDLFHDRFGVPNYQDFGSGLVNMDDPVTGTLEVAQMNIGLLTQELGGSFIEDLLRNSSDWDMALSAYADVLNARENELSPAGNGTSIIRTSASGDLVWHLDAAGDQVSYSINVEPASYSLTLRYSNNDAGPGDRIAVLLDGSEVAVIATQNTGDWNEFVNSGFVSLGPLPAGEHEVSFRLDQTDGFGVDLDFFWISDVLG